MLYDSAGRESLWQVIGSERFPAKCMERTMGMKGLAIGLVCARCVCAFAAEGWWDKEFPYRIPVTVDSGMYERNDYLVRLPLNLMRIARKAKMPKGIDVASLRAIELDADAGTMKEIPSIFKKKNYVAGKKETGTLIWQMKGKTPTMTERVYHVYCDTRDTGKKPATYEPIPGADETPGENLVPNGGFEKVDKKNRPVGWSQISRTKKTVGSARVTRKETHSGKQSLHISKPTLEGDSCMYSFGGWRSPIKIKPNTKYRLSARVKATGKGQQCVQLYFAADEWKSTKLSAYVMPCGIGAHEWKEISGVVKSPADARYACVRIHLWKSQGDAYFDDIAVRELPSVQPPNITVGALEKRE